MFHRCSQLYRPCASWPYAACAATDMFAVVAQREQPQAHMPVRFLFGPSLPEGDGCHPLALRWGSPLLHKSRYDRARVTWRSGLRTGSEWALMFSEVFVAHVSSDKKVVVVGGFDEMVNCTSLILTYTSSVEVPRRRI